MILEPNRVHCYLHLEYCKAVNYSSLDRCLRSLCCIHNNWFINYDYYHYCQGRVLVILVNNIASAGKRSALLLLAALVGSFVVLSFAAWCHYGLIKIRTDLGERAVVGSGVATPWAAEHVLGRRGAERRGPLGRGRGDRKTSGTFSGWMTAGALATNCIIRPSYAALHFQTERRSTFTYPDLSLQSEEFLYLHYLQF